MIDGYDYDTSIIIGRAAHAMDYHARNGGDESKARTVELMKQAAERLGFDLIPRQTPAEAHEAAISARRAEDGPEQIEDMEWSR